ncbi:type II toxin-antitoxin system VapB family antitoxin [Halochromatium glycolicum]|uniref:DUF2191 domain-containing protein n=1 Tax=Halochromatium glycolicum TaxID=85075 RepID=A0AAJ0XC60_9GAMM|nr:type II toxin-antitoxin system VapB family antitoxin [Halochromatium glycolicum]MBK1707043.1 hypothetical protein [Halochromatium glycolicum]
MTTEIPVEDRLLRQGLTLTGLEQPQEVVELALRELVERRMQRPEHSGRPPRRPGSAKGKLRVLEEDQAHLEDFRGYMP